MFEPFELEYRGEKYEVAPDDVMGLIAVIEQHIFLDELMTNRVQVAKSVRAYKAALHYAFSRNKETRKKKVTDHELFTWFKEGKFANLAEANNTMMRAILQLANEDDDEDAEPEPEDGDIDSEKKLEA